MIQELDWLKKWAQYSPTAIAVMDADTGAEVSYQQLFDGTNRFARILREKYSIREGDRVAVLSHNELEYIMLFFATQRLGAILVPINFRLTGREVEHILNDCAPKLLIHQRRFQELVNGLPSDVVPQHLMFFDGPESMSAMLVDRNLPADLIPMCGDENTKVMILYTSGTTGSPKGAIITHGMLFWNSINTSLRLNIVQQDVTLAFLPFFHTGGWNVLTTPFLHRGAKVILLKKFEAERILQLVDQEKLSIIFGVPTMMDMMYRSPMFAKSSLKTLRYAIVGGEPMPIELIRAWQEKGIPIRQGYGLTEFGPNVFSLNEEDSIRKIGSIGFTNFYIDAKIVDDQGMELGAEQIGELILRGPMCTLGYWNNPEATSATIKDGWLYTGDLVRRDSEGYYYVVGRKKDMFISGGENVYPAEVEKFLRTHPSIRDVAVIGVPDDKWGEVGKAFVVAEPTSKLTAEKIASFCLGNLAKYKIPKYVHFMDELPKGDSGKILKRALKDL